MPKFRYVGLHAMEFEVGDKRIMLGPGEYIEMSNAEAEPHGNLLLHITPTQAQKSDVEVVGGEKT